MYLHNSRVQDTESNKTQRQIAGHPRYGEQRELESSELIQLEPSNCKRAWETEAAFPTTETTIVLYLCTYLFVVRVSLFYLVISEFLKMFAKKKAKLVKFLLQEEFPKLCFDEKKNNKISRKETDCCI
jgi:hypothetical protein